MSQALLSSAYFGPVQWFQKLHRYDRCLIERYDNYVKQTYRSRCVIAATGGPQTLTVPIERYDGSKCLMRDIRISDHGAWRHVHWNAIVSSYGESPFFDYYADDILPFFERRWKYLYDFNLDITHTVCSLLDIRPVIEPTSDYIRTEDVAADDFRDAIRPKHPLPDAAFEPRPYYQVYSRKHGFLPNLSILDLLFNEGPEGIFLL